MSNFKIKSFNEIEDGDKGFFLSTVGRGITLKSADLACVAKFMSLLTFEDSEGQKTSLDYINHDLLGSRFMVEDPLPNVPGTLIQIEEVTLVQAIDTVPVNFELPTLAVLTSGGNWATVNGNPAVHLVSREITEWSHVKVVVRT